jgi:DNA-binding NtrC family response regulator
MRTIATPRRREFVHQAGRFMATLLYVDDEETIGRAVARWFGRRGHTVHLAHSIASAQAVLAEHAPDALFLDVWLGTESGFELLSWIEEAHPELARRVTFVTGELADGDQSVRVWRTLGRPVLQKPFDFAQLEQYFGPAADGGMEQEPRADAPRQAGQRDGT